MAVFLLTPAVLLGGTSAVAERSVVVGLVALVLAAVKTALYLGVGGLITITGMNLESFIRRR
jgi:hypothetical protein